MASFRTRLSWSTLLSVGTTIAPRLNYFSNFRTHGWSNTLIKGIRSEVSCCSIALTRFLYSLDRPDLNFITPRIIFSLISRGCPPVNGALPCASSYSRIPSAQTSRVWSCGLFYIISGAIYSNVPQNVFLY